MSGTAPQSLASIVDSIVPESTQAPSTPAPVSPPSLQSVIDSNPSGSGAGSPPPEPAPAATSKPGTGQASSQQTEQQAAVLRALLTQRGLTIPDEFTSDDQIADALVAEFDAASAAQNSAEYKQFLAWQKAQNATQQQPPASPAPEKPQSPQISERDLLNAVRMNIVTQDPQSKKWGSAYPAYAHFADAMNDQDARSNQAKISLASDPEAFIKQKLDEALATVKPQGEISELKELLQQIRQERESVQITQVDSWVNENAAKLYVPGTRSLTPYGTAYQTIEASVQAAKPNIGILERHNEVLKQLAVFQQAFMPAQPQQAAAAAAPALLKPSFLDAAARRNGSNRLSEYTGPAANSVAPQIPRGKNGVPSLQGLIDQQTSLTSN